MQALYLTLWVLKSPGAGEGAPVKGRVLGRAVGLTARMLGNVGLGARDQGLARDCPLLNRYELKHASHISKLPKGKHSVKGTVPPA